MKLISIAAVGIFALTLTGCSAVTDLMHNETATDFDDVAAFEEDWPRAGQAAWVPGDAEDIHVRESSGGDPAIIGFDSGSLLDPTQCVETERLSGPSFTDDWAPEKVYVDDIFACGDWAVMKTDDGWFGWTPSAPGEQEVAPAP
jgi:hypothetical protein